jgi:2-keto-4-pentenoate hydratase/2-oxohepta-3-ene-1,7-dioic acid hydratase in catechol pathway
MRLVSYRSARGVRAGVLANGGALDAWDALGEPDGVPFPGIGAPGPAAVGPSLRALLAAGRVEDFREAIAAGSQVEPVEAPELLPPIPDPTKILCLGLNYRAHAAEAGMEPPESPTFFAKFANALAAPGATIPFPEASRKLDFEAEVAFVIGRRASAVAPEEALDHVAGYTLLNDLSARDLQFATSQWMPGKVFDGAAPCGPAIVTPDEAGAADVIEIALDLNGERMQEASTADLIFSIPDLVSRLSELMTLEPGDIISTGTPAGVGSTRQPRVWLKPGDAIEVSSPTLGRLDTTIG